MCGIFGINLGNGNEYGNIERLRLHSLGVSMDTRGGDSYGLYYDGVVYKSMTPPKYESGAKEDNSPKLPHALKGKTLIGHTRKASSGGKNFETCQPLVAKIGKDKIVIAHNGTLRNEDDLVEKYKLKDVCTDENVDAMSDSMILARLILIKGFSILSEYYGAASLMMEITREGEEPKTYVFSGESKKTENSMTVDIERPLHYVKSGGNVYIGSTEYALNKLKFNTKGTQIPGSTVFELKNGNLVEIEKIDRSKVAQAKCYTRTTNTNHSSAYGYGGASFYDNYNDFYNDTYYQRNRLPQQTTVNRGNNNTKFDRNVTKNTLEEPCTSHVTMVDGMYHYDGKICHGVYDIDQYGSCGFFDDIIDLDDLPNNAPAYQFRRYFFYEGNMLKNKDAFIIVVREIEKAKGLKNFDNLINEIKNAGVCYKKVSLTFSKAIISTFVSLYSRFPVNLVDFKSEDYGATCYFDEFAKDSQRFFTGTVKYPWSDFNLQFDNGDLVKITDSNEIGDKFFVLSKNCLVEGSHSGTITVVSDDRTMHAEGSIDRLNHGPERKDKEDNHTPVDTFATIADVAEQASCDNCYYEGVYPVICGGCIRNPEPEDMSFDGIELDPKIEEEVDYWATQAELEQYVDEFDNAVVDIVDQIKGIEDEKARNVTILIEECLSSVKSIMLNQ